MILILGGTTEAMALAHEISARAQVPAILSLAGRTQNPSLPPIPHRVGGFGGIDGLVRYCREAGVSAILDATHPFAARMKANAAAAATITGIPILALRRPAWKAVAGDRWTHVKDAASARAALSTNHRRVFLTAGRLELPAFVDDLTRFYLVRSIDAPDALPRHSQLRLDRGPFDRIAEEVLMRQARIDVLVTKNSGGSATFGKIEAARALRLPVILIERPPVPDVPSVETLADALLWLEAPRRR